MPETSSCMSSGRRFAPSIIWKRCGRRRAGTRGGRADNLRGTMRIVVAAVGRLKQGPETELSERYRKRAAQTGRQLGLRDIEIIEIRESRAADAGKRMVEESIALANVIPEGAVTVMLDERGDSLGSADFADHIRKWRDAGVPAAVFIIGGPDG